MSDNDEIWALLMGVLGGVAAASVIVVLAEHVGELLNRYQIAAAANSPASEVAKALEIAAEKGYVVADGEANNPNVRSYKLEPGLLVR